MKMLNSSSDEETFSDLETNDRPNETPEKVELHCNNFYIVQIHLEQGKVCEKHYVGRLLEIHGNSETAELTFLRHKKGSIFYYPEKEDRLSVPLTDIVKYINVTTLGSTSRQNCLLSFDLDTLMCYPNLY